MAEVSTANDFNSDSIIPSASANADNQSTPSVNISELPEEEQARLWVDSHLPELNMGEFYCWSKRTLDSGRRDWDKKEYPFQNNFCQTKDDLIEQVLRTTKNPDIDVFVSPATFGRKERKKNLVVSRRNIAFDFDVKTPADSPAAAAKKYPDLKTAAKAAFELGARLGAKMTFIKSGRGVHSYVVLDEDYPNNKVKVLADALKQWALSEGFKIDESVTGDMTRLMRMPGTVWRKNKEGLQVVLGNIGEPLSITEVWSLLKAASKGVEKPSEAQLFRDAETHKRVDALTASLAGYEPLIVSQNRAAIAGAVDFLISKKVMDESYMSWWVTVKDLSGARQADEVNSDDAQFLHDEAVRFSKASASWDEVEFQTKWDDPGIADGRIRNLFSRAQALGWRNPGRDAPDAQLFDAVMGGGAEALRDLDGQKIPARLGLVIAAMLCPEIAGVRLAYDTFTGEASISNVAEDTWTKLTDSDVIELRVRLENQCFKGVSAEMARDALKGVMGRNRMDSAKTWADDLPVWDGVKRVSGFMVEYFKSKDTPYATGVSEYLWSALAGRLIEPGCKCDMVPILVGDQGSRKSSGVMALSPNPEAFTELNFHRSDDDTKRILRGRLVIELAELAGMGKRDAEALKSFLSARFDEWRPNYHEGVARYNRRGIFIGTSNRNDFLKDSTGHRRFLPINVGIADVERIERDRNQLWAEAIVLFKKHGVLYASAEQRAKDEHAEFEQEDPLGERLEQLLKTGPFPYGGRHLWDEPFLKLDGVMTLLGVEPKDMARMRGEITAALRGLGYRKTKRRWIAGENPFHAWSRIPFQCADDVLGTA